MKKGRLENVLALIIGAVVLLFLAVTLPDVSSSVRAGRPWTSLLGCLFTLWIMVASGRYWYKTDPWNVSVVSPGGAFALCFFALSIVAAILLWLYLKRLPNDSILVPGPLAGLASVMVDSARLVMPVASLAGVWFLVQPFITYRPPRDKASRSGGRNQ